MNRLFLIMKTSRVVIGSLVLCRILLAGLWVRPALAEPAFSHVTRQPVVGIIGIPEETELLASMLEHPKVRAHGNFRFTAGALNGRKVVLAQVGYGKVSSAAGAAILLNEYDVDCVIFSGTAGALNPDFIQGDVIIGCDLAQHDLGQISKEGFSQWVGTLPMEGADVPRWFSPPESFMAVARDAGRAAKLDRAESTSGVRDPRVWEGVIVSGDSFISDTSKSAELRKRFGADAVEMEGAAVAQICYQSGVPCLVVRSITDRADGSAFLTYQQFVKIASHNSAMLVSDIIGRLQGDDLFSKTATAKKQMWCLISGLGFATNSPYATQFAAFAQEVPDDQKERILRPIFEKMVDAATRIASARKVGVTFQPGASGSGLVTLGASVIIEATRENARKAAAILGYLGERSTVIGITESGPFARRALLVENAQPGGWDDLELLKTRWPQLAAKAPEATPGFSRVKTPGSDGLLIIDRTGSWSCSNWYDGAEQIKSAAGQVGLQVKVTRVSPAYFEIQTSWDSGNSGWETLNKMLDADQLEKIRQANIEVSNLMGQYMTPLAEAQK
jgi:adenosylhomocysteine nucleosidase